jgi:hypothetical protein
VASNSPEKHGKTDGNGGWEAVVAPIDCNYYSITGQDPFDKASDPEDQNQWTRPSAFTVTGAHFSISSAQTVRWKKGDTVTWVRSAAPLSLYFLR